MSLTQILRTDATADWGFVNLPINCADKSDVNWPWKYWTKHQRAFGDVNFTEIKHNGVGAYESEMDSNTGIYNTSQASVEVAFAYIATDPVPAYIELTASCYVNYDDEDIPRRGRGLTMDIRLFDAINFVDVPVTDLLDWMGDFISFEQQTYSGELPATAIPKVVYIRCMALADLDANVSINVILPNSVQTP